MFRWASSLSLIHIFVTKQEATLEVRITKIETWQEEIPYASETPKSNEYNVGTKKTTQAGENGIRRVTAQRVYDTNGTQLSQQILSTEVIKEPVTEKIVVDVYKRQNRKPRWKCASPRSRPGRRRSPMPARRPNPTSTTWAPKRLRDVYKRQGLECTVK